MPRNKSQAEIEAQGNECTALVRAEKKLVRCKPQMDKERREREMYMLALAIGVVMFGGMK